MCSRSTSNSFLRGQIEPHAYLLTIPPENTLLYKIMRVEHFLDSVSGDYLHFNRVDSYSDSQNADRQDGQQLPQDKALNEKSLFESAQNFSAAEYFDQSRSRTYACCFSVENSAYIWDNYGNGGDKGKVCLVFNFYKLRQYINSLLDKSWLVANMKTCEQLFSVNYGLVKYVSRNTHKRDTTKLANPIEYGYFKDIKFKDEKELRVTLSALGVGDPTLNGNRINFTPSLQVGFNFKYAFENGIILQIEHSPELNLEYLQREMSKSGAVLTR